MTANISDILAQAEDPSHRRTSTARILLSQDLHEQHAILEAELERVTDEDGQHNRRPEAPAVAERLAALEATIEEAMVEFRFRALSRKGWVDLLAAHPPTKAQLAEAAKTRSGLDHNPETFPAALIAACAIDPEMSVEDAHRLENSLHFTQFEVLYATAMECNTGGLSNPKSAAAGLILRLREQSGATAVREESGAASS